MASTSGGLGRRLGAVLVADERRGARGRAPRGERRPGHGGGGCDRGSDDEVRMRKRNVSWWMVGWEICWGNWRLLEVGWLICWLSEM